MDFFPPITSVRNILSDASLLGESIEISGFVCSDISKWPSAHYWVVEVINGQIQGVYDSLKGLQRLTTDVSKKLRVTGLLLCKTRSTTPKMCSALLEEAAGKFSSTMRQTRPIKVHCRQQVLTLRKCLKKDHERLTSKKKTSSKFRVRVGRSGNKLPKTSSPEVRKTNRGVNRETTGGELRKSQSCANTKSSISKKKNAIDNRAATRSTDPASAAPLLTFTPCRLSDECKPNIENVPLDITAQGPISNEQSTGVAEGTNDNGIEAKGEACLSHSKKRCTTEEEKCQHLEPESHDISKVRKTAPGSFSEKTYIEVAAGCSAYHSSVQDESIIRTAGCSVYPANDFQPVEQLRNAEMTKDAHKESQPQGRYGIISLFDGVSSVVPLLKKKIGYAPVAVILAENDNRIRSIVCSEFGYRSDEEWCLTADGSAALYLRDVHSLVAKGCRLLQVRNSGDISVICSFLTLSRQ